MHYQDISSLYIHFPYCKHLCNYCDFHKKILYSKDQISTFQNSFIDSWKQLRIILDKYEIKILPLETLYIGGGTPSLWDNQGFEFLSQFFEDNSILFSPNIEFTLEVNPGEWRDESISNWRKLGVNRFSIGAQTFNANLLPLLDRVHTLQDTFDTLSYFKELKVPWSADLMLGIPASEQRDLENEVETLLGYTPHHISAYIFNVSKNYKHRHLLPSEEATGNEYNFLATRLKKANYRHYEVSNFALPGLSSVHNMRYWDLSSMLALGPSATGLLYHSEEKALRYKWTPAMPTQLTFEPLNKSQIYLEKIYLALRTHKGVNLKDFFTKEQINKISLIHQKWLDQGLVTQSFPLVKATSKGFLFMDSLLNQLFYFFP